MYIEIKSEKDLPPERKYVLGRHKRGTWIDEDDQENVNCVVVKLIKGISVEDRNKMITGELPDYEYGPLSNLSQGYHFTKRSSIYSPEDEHGNNIVPYSWDSFGPDTFFGQDITHWQPIEKLNN